MEKEDFRKLKNEVRDPLRKRAIAMIKKGIRKKEVASIMGVHVNTITHWCKSCAAKGSKGLTALKRGVKSEDKKLLTKEQEQQIQEMILDVMPDRSSCPMLFGLEKQ